MDEKQQKGVIMKNVMVCALMVALSAIFGCHADSEPVVTNGENRTGIASGSVDRDEILWGVESIFYKEYGAPFSPIEEVTVVIKTKAVSIVCFEDYEAEKLGKPRGKADFICTEKEWRGVTNLLASAGIGGWKSRYVNPNICDGTFWRLELKKENETKKYSGANDFPEGFKNIFKLKRFAMSKIKR